MLDFSANVLFCALGLVVLLIDQDAYLLAAAPIGKCQCNLKARHTSGHLIINNSLFPMTFDMSNNHPFLLNVIYSFRSLYLWP